jgi:hypothetical protein
VLRGWPRRAFSGLHLCAGTSLGVLVFSWSTTKRGVTFGSRGSGVGGDAVEAVVGDTIIVRSRHVGTGERRGEVVGVRGDGGGPPWLVRWASDGHEALYFPGSDVLIVHGVNP